jgi:ABC-type transport system involved in multi-copper enzyme maturation permease subunit
MLLIEAPLVGYGFTQAVFLFTQASRSAIRFAELAKGMEPMQGVFVPTFGSLYLVLTLLFPFIAIRLMRGERDSNSLKLLLQMPVSPGCIVLAKLVAVMLAWIASLIPLAAALIVWIANGGHVFLPALFVLLLGYALYSLIIAAVAFGASVTTDSPTSAAILTLAITLGMWVLDFAGSTTGILRSFSFISLTESLRKFETGLLSAPDTLLLIIIAVALLSVSAICIHPGTATRFKILRSALVAVFAGAVAVFASFSQTAVDFSEDSHNSFNPAYERALRSMDQPLRITVNLSADDSRLQEMERNVFAKLRRNVPHLRIVYSEESNKLLFTTPEDDRYGLIVYEYAGSKDEVRSNSPTEILPILFKLSGQTVNADPVPNYSGYPLVLEKTNGELLFYCVLPVAILACWWYLHLPPRIKEFGE